MKRFFTICGALVVGIVLVGPVHAGTPHAGKGTGQHAGKRTGQQAGKHTGRHARHHSGRHWRPHRPKPGLLPLQLLPEQSPAPAAYDPAAGANVPGGTAVDPSAVGYDQTVPGTLSGGDIGGQTVTQPPGTPQVGGQPRLPRSGDSSPQGSGAGPSR